MDPTYYFWVLVMDGGGVRGLSPLIILTNIMERAGTVPGDVFTAAGGTSAGGLNALMIGRLQLPLANCDASFCNMSQRVFGHRYSLWRFLEPRYSHLRMMTEMQSIIQSAGVARDAFMQVPGLQASAMHTYVVCREIMEGQQLGNGHSAIGTRPGHGINCEIWEAGRATSAAPTYFSPQSIGGQTFVDGGLGFNNPISTINDELDNLGLGEIDKKRICYISIGTGKLSNDELQNARRLWRSRARSSLLSLVRWVFWLLPSSSAWGQLAGYLNDPHARAALLDLGMEENAHLRFKEQIEVEGADPGITRYFRFNCDKQFDRSNGYSLTDSALDEHGDLMNIRHVTGMYLTRDTENIERCAGQIAAQNIAFLI